jgi:PAS domain S-box-containing protein
VNPINAHFSFLDVAVESLTEGVVFVSGNGEIVHMNPEALRIHGFSSLKEMPRHAEQYPLRMETLDGRLLELKDWPIHRMLRGETFKEMEVRLSYTGPKSTREWIGSYGDSPILQDGEVVAGVLTVRDITQSKAHELQIRQLADSMTQMAWIAQPDGSIHWYNRRWYEYTGANFEEMEGSGWQKVHHPDHLERVAVFMKQAWNKPEAWELTFPLRSASGEWRWFLTRAVPLTNSEGQVTQWFGTNTDIHAEREARIRVELLASVVDASRDFIGVFTPDTRGVLVNKYGRELVGVPEAEVPNTKVIDYFADFDRAKILNEIVPTVQKTGYWEGELHFKHFRTGKLIPVIYNIFPIHDRDSGALLYYATVTSDITERKVSEESLNYQRQLLQTITDNAASCLFMMNKDGHPTFMNPAAEKLTGYKLTEIQGRPLHYAVHYRKPDGSPYPMEECPIDNAQAELKPLQNQEEIFVDKAGRLYPVSYSIAPLEKDGEVVGSVLEFRDITETKRGEASLREAVLARDEFLSIASHELKTPLTSLKLQAQLMQRSIRKRDPRAFSEDRLLSMAEQTDRQVSRLSRLVDDMLDVSRIRSGRLTIEPEQEDLREIIRDVIEQLKNQFIQGSYEVPSLLECEECVGRWDRLRMEQAVTNLLTNAIRYGEGKPIFVQLHQEKDTVHLSVQDRGIGIAPEARDKIFERFERAINANDVSGLGLGLFITKQIVLAHGGRIWVESELGKGSTFHVTLPRS